VVITDANGVIVTSSKATLTVNAPSSISTQPQSVSVTVGQAATASFTIGTSGGTGPLTVQWQISTDQGASFTNLNEGSGIAGTTTTKLVLSSFATAASVAYRAIVTDANQVSVTSTAAVLTVNPTPSIATQPMDQSAVVGQTSPASFTITTSGGNMPLTIQWQVSVDHGVSFSNLSDGTGVSGATTATLTVSGFDAAGPREYRAVVTDAANVTATSNVAILTINTPLTPNQHFLSQVYNDFFHRPVDASGLATWSAVLDQGVPRIRVVSLIQSSFEYRADVVGALYTKVLHRAVDPSGLNTFTLVLGNGGTALQVEVALIGSAEYFQLRQFG
jgi:hypothetical protein